MEQKQNFLREEIIEKGYDPNKFSTFLEEIKGDYAYDLINWTMDELKDQVANFIQLINKQTNISLDDNPKQHSHENDRVTQEGNGLNSVKDQPDISEPGKELLNCRILEKSIISNIEHMTISITKYDLINN